MSITVKTHNTRKGDVDVYTITNASGASVKLSAIGAGIVEVNVPDKEGNLANVVLGYKDIDSYFYDGPCAGKVPGRYANRIAKGDLVIDGVKYQLNINNGPNALHGGPEGFANRVWEGREVDSNGVEFTLNSPHLDENYPGNLCVKVTYHWLDGNILTIDFEAVTDKKTAVNLTNHAYFNLDGENAGTVLNHKLQLHCSRFLPTDDTLIPSGEMAAVEGTPMDFLQPKELGKDIKQNFPALVYGKGYDNCWVVDDYTPGKVREVAILSAEHSGRVLKVYTNQPAAQVYTGNWLAGCPENPEGRSYNDYDGVAIECQGMPDAPHHSNFPNQILNVDEKYERRIEFHFGV